MILPFSTKIKGKPTHFVERIHSGLIANGLMDGEDENCLTHEEYDMNAFSEKHKKIHTIREDKAKRWKPGTKIDFFINARQKNMFRFAPVLPVISVQKVFMTYAYGDLIQISIDDRELIGYNERLQFALNDGFDSWEDFLDYFYPKIQESKEKFFKGKLIHWTNLSY